MILVPGGAAYVRESAPRVCGDDPAGFRFDLEAR